MRKLIYILSNTLGMMLLLLSYSNMNAQLDIELENAIKLGGTTTNTAGTIRYNGSDFQGFNGTIWQSLTAGAGSSPWNTSGSDIYFDTGNVGIGIMNPTEDLHIVGTTEIRRNSTFGTPHLRIYEEDISNGGSTRVSFQHGNDLNNEFELRAFLGVGVDHRIGWSYNNALRVVWNETTGGFGIGTAFPDELLELNFSGNNGIKIDGDGTGDARLWINNDFGNHFIFDDVSDASALVFESANDMVFSTNGPNARMRILELNGEVGINGGENVNRRLGIQTTNDLYALYSDQNGTATAYGAYITTESNGAQSKYGSYSAIGGTAGSGVSFAVYGSASTTPADFYAVYALGDMHYTGTLTNSSDARVKKNIKPLNSVLDKLMQVETKTFEFDNEKYPYANFADGMQTGFIAQNIQNIFPNLVENQRHVFNVDSSEEDGEFTEMELNILGMKSIEMIPILTKAIQEQQDLIKAMRQELDQLKSESK